MAKRKNKQLDPPAPLPSYIVEHYKRLKVGLKTDKEYLAWCKQNGFSKSSRKTWGQLGKERAIIVRAKADLEKSRRKKNKNPRTAIESIFSSDEVDPKEYVRYEFVRKLAHDKATKYGKLRVGRYKADPSGLKEFLLFIEKETDFVEDTDGGSFFDAMLEIHVRSNLWVRPLGEWRAKSHNADKQFSSLVRHLFAEYDIPLFLDRAWFEDGTSGSTTKKWFIHIGSGKNIRTAENLPMPLTKKMAHFFLQAPKDCSPHDAIRWGHVLAVGGNDRLAEISRYAHMSKYEENIPFWESVYKLFINNQMLDYAHFGPIVDYIANQKFEQRWVWVERGVREQEPPPQPNFSMRGRTPDSLLNQVEQWHRLLGRETKSGKDLQWEKCGLNGIKFKEGKEGNLRFWEIRELLSAKELMQEGREMKHCVASYAGSCANGRTSIWTMECESFEGTKKELTIEIDFRNKRVVEARGKLNASPSAKARNLMQRWMHREKLKSGKYLFRGFF